MLIDYQYLPNKKKLIVSYIGKTGSILLKHFDMDQPYTYEVCDHNDPDKEEDKKSWDGHFIKKIPTSYPDRYFVYEFLDHLSEKDKKEIFEYQEPKIYFIDIETEILSIGDPLVDGFPEAKDQYDNDGNLIKKGASSRVLSISIVWDDKIVLMGLEDMSDEIKKRIEDNTNEYFKKDGVKYNLKYVKYEDEFTLLQVFFEDMIPKMPVLTGWNFLNYDWVYLINRAKKISKFYNGREIKININKTSLTSKLIKIFGTDYEVPQHRLIFDYMQLYEILDTSIKVKESSSLDFVSNKLVGVEKIKYTGSLQRLYEDDFETFMYYNAVDSVLVQKIHQKKNYISIIWAISELSRIRIVDVVSQINGALGSLAITEGVLRERFREWDGTVLFKDKNKNSSAKGIAGGWVKDPIVGMNKWCVTYDFASLYPITEIQFFLSPENYIGLVDSKDNTRTENGILIDKKIHVVCNNGTVFLKRISPTIQMLIDVYKDRKVNKKIMMKKKDEYHETLDEIKKLEMELNI
jgi:DNA polymerase elongation subunit (family B)